MGIKIANMEAYVSAAVVGDGLQKTITHNMNTIPSFVLLTPLTNGVDAYLVSKGQNTVVVVGALGTFDVLIVR